MKRHQRLVELKRKLKEMGSRHYRPAQKSSGIVSMPSVSHAPRAPKKTPGIAPQTDSNRLYPPLKRPEPPKLIDLSKFTTKESKKPVQQRQQRQVSQIRKTQPVPQIRKPIVTEAATVASPQQSQKQSVSSTVVSPVVSPKNFYKGDNVHAYTSDIRSNLAKWLPIIEEKSGKKSLSKLEFTNLCADLKVQYGPKPAIDNMLQNFHEYANSETPGSDTEGGITDPQLPGLDAAILLLSLWKTIQDESMVRHFGETLDQIGSTCIQGITHRLFCDFVALSKDTNK